MTEIKGMPITEIKTSGWSDDGRHVWVTLQAANGQDQTQIFPVEIVGFFIQALEHTMRESYGIRVSRNPSEAKEGLFSAVVPIKELSVAKSPEHPGWIFQILTLANVPISLGVPNDIAKQLADGLQDAIDAEAQNPHSGSSGPRH